MTPEIPPPMAPDLEPTSIQPEAQSSRPSWPMRRISLVVVGMLLLAIGSFLGLRSPAAKPEKRNANGQVISVTVTTVTQKTVPVQINAIGNVQAASTVAITPQASGRITGVFFKKGEEVQKGQLLFTLDDRSQTAVIQQARGTVARSGPSPAG